MNYDILDAPLGEDNTIIREKATLFKKIQSIIIDYLFFMVISMIFVSLPVAFFIALIIFAPYSSAYIFIYLLIVPLSIMMFSLYLIKDIFNGASFGKQYTGLLIIDVKTNLPASEFKCILRNITIPFWFIECLFTLISPSRRLGDFIAGTEVLQTQALTFAEIRQIFKERERGKLLKYSGGISLAILSFMSLLIFA